MGLKVKADTFCFFNKHSYKSLACSVFNIRILVSVDEGCSIFFMFTSNFYSRSKINLASSSLIGVGLSILYFVLSFSFLSSCTVHHPPCPIENHHHVCYALRLHPSIPHTQDHRPDGLFRVLPTNLILICKNVLISYILLIFL